MRMATLLALFMTTMAAGTCPAQSLDPSEAIIMDRLKQVGSLFTPTPVAFDTLFTPSFRSAIPEEQLVAGAAQLRAMAGDPVGYAITGRKGPWAVSAVIRTSKQMKVPIELALEAAPPHRVEGLFMRPPVKETASLQAIVDELKALPGRTALSIVDLKTGASVIDHQGAAMMPLGSACKLFILGEAGRAVAAGSMRWSDVVTLDSNRFSLPSGILHTWPHGSPITVHTLATMMISTSDNTATDHLLHHCGPRKVADHQRAMGHRQPSINWPFFSTRDLFVLKFSDGGNRARRWAAGSVAEREAMVRRELPAVPRQDIDFVARPVLPDSVEWFACTQDMVKAMDWFRRQAGDAPDHPLLGILGVNAGLDVDHERFPYVGFKGGSEPGVINMTYLLRRSNGTWYGMSASWSNPADVIDEGTFVGLVGRAIQLLP